RDRLMSAKAECGRQTVARGAALMRRLRISVLSCLVIAVPRACSLQRASNRNGIDAPILLDRLGFANVTTSHWSVSEEPMRARRQRNLSRHQKIFLQKRLSHNGYPLNGPKSNFAAFSGKGHEAIFEFHASPLPGGFSPRRRISLALLQPTPGDSTRAATRWWRTHPWEVLVWPSGLSRRPDWISALSGSLQ